ncbi:MAG: hypothetical protein JNL32_09055 [Candidatus Kapabacteria bacterium]|nr:hypothetical protein [Candidatus Kapabacteria bacterium]
MAIELIPVLEVGYNNQGVQIPDNHFYWDNSEIWDDFHSECYKKAGFKDKLIPYLKGSSFYRLTDISDDNLKKLTIDHTQDLKEQSCSFFGGYVLRVDNQDRLYPQCCGLLADINFWENISNGKKSYYEGHPVPQIVIKGNSITFDLRTNEFDEIFQPPPPVLLFQVDKAELGIAIEKTIQELVTFAKRLERINTDYNLQITNIANVLIWSDDNH